ncbi:MAG: sulfatase-like hydrolase/transferase [Bacteroidota bacterium]
MKSFLSLIFGCMFLSFFSADKREGPPSIESPNIIILLADDLGYGDLGAYGGEALTPNLDKLAASGIRFTDFYAAAPNCSPSRAGLMSGRSPSVIGVYNYLPARHPMHMRSEVVSIAEILKQNGYQTGVFGKWHLSDLIPNEDDKQPSPHDQGFDHFFATKNNAQPSHLNPVNFVRNGVKVGKQEGYSCDIVVSEALDWLGEKEQDVPYFLYVPFHEPHKKVASPPELVGKYLDKHDNQNAEYLANVENMDRAIGKLLAGLEEKGLDKNTFILFASDNGSYRKGSNGELLGGKSFVYEGGIRVPGIMSWKGGIEPGQEISEPAGLVDMMPTICELIGVQHPAPEQLAGTSLKPLLMGENFIRDKPLSWFFYRTFPEMAMRMGNYSVLGSSPDTSLHTHPFSAPDMDHIKSLKLEGFELYDLASDLSQTKDVFGKNEKLADSLRKQLLIRFKEIQEAGYVWEHLPEVGKKARKKRSEWRKLRPEGFSN